MRALLAVDGSRKVLPLLGNYCRESIASTGR
jgi:hypothetical protein